MIKPNTPSAQIAAVLMGHAAVSERQHGAMTEQTSVSLAVLSEVPELLVLAATSPDDERLRGVSLRINNARQYLADALTQRDAEIARLREIGHGAQQSYPLLWRPVPETLPPPECDGDQHSERVWLALDDGSVRLGSCHYRPPNATYADPVHAWEVDGLIDDDQKVIAWMPFAVPCHPNTLNNPS
jgi:hypothetical protein